jgi:hypothetical protein
MFVVELIDGLRPVSYAKGFYTQGEQKFQSRTVELAALTGQVERLQVAGGSGVDDSVGELARARKAEIGDGLQVEDWGLVLRGFDAEEVGGVDIS